MKQLIARLRQLEASVRAAETREYRALLANELANALPQLLDRLEKLEVVAILSEAVVTHCNHEDLLRLKYALAALEKK